MCMRLNGGAVLYGLLTPNTRASKVRWGMRDCRYLCSVDMLMCVFIYPSTYHLPTILTFTDCLLGYHLTTYYHHLSFYDIICILFIIYLYVIYQYRYYMCICLAFISIYLCHSSTDLPITYLYHLCSYLFFHLSSIYIYSHHLSSLYSSINKPPFNNYLSSVCFCLSVYLS